MSLRLLVLLLIELLGVSAAAKGLSCAAPAIEVFPASGATLSANPVFIVQGRDAAGKAVSELGAGDAVLQLEGGKAQLHIARRGGLRSPFVVLALEQNQLPRGSVTLLLRSRLGGGEPTFRPFGSWTVEGSSDISRPEFTQNPRKPVVRVEAGGSVSATFEVSTSEYPVAVLASLDEVVGDFLQMRPTEVAMFPKQLSLFMNACGSNADLRRGRSYVVDLVLVDAAGNLSSNSPAHVAFTIPK